MTRGVMVLDVVTGFVWIADVNVAASLRHRPAHAQARLGGDPGPAPTLYYGGGYLWATIHRRTRSSASTRAREAGDHRGRDAGRTARCLTAGGRVFVACYADHSVRVLDPRTASVDGEPLAVPHNPFALAADDHTVWVTGPAENTLTRIAYR